MCANRPSRRTFLTASLTAVAGLAGCALPGPQETTVSTRTVEATGGAPLVVENHNGNVTVTDGGGDAIEMTVTKRTNYGRERFDQVRVETDTTSQRTRIETVSEDLPTGVSVAVDLELALPEGVPVERVRTRNGDVTAEDVAGDAHLETTNGRVDARDVAGYLTMRTTNGTVESRDCDGIDDVRTTNGSADVEVQAIRDDVDVETTNGNVRIAVPEDMDAEIRLETTNGDVGYSGLDLDVRTDRTTELVGTLGDGGDEITGETTNGSVRLRAI